MQQTFFGTLEYKDLREQGDLGRIADEAMATSRAAELRRCYLTGLLPNAATCNLGDSIEDPETGSAFYAVRKGEHRGWREYAWPHGDASGRSGPRRCDPSAPLLFPKLSHKREDPPLVLGMNEPDPRLADVLRQKKEILAELDRPDPYRDNAHWKDKMSPAPRSEFLPPLGRPKLPSGGRRWTR